VYCIENSGSGLGYAKDEKVREFECIRLEKGAEKMLCQYMIHQESTYIT
jgi:hypothetical protein